MTHRSTKRKFSLATVLLLSALEQPTFAQATQWVSKAPAGRAPAVIRASGELPSPTPAPSESSPAQGATPAPTNLPVPNGPVVIYLPPGYQLPLGSVTVDPSAPQQLPAGNRAPLGPAPALGEAWPVVPRKPQPEDHGLFRWPDGMVTEYGNDSFAPPQAEAKRSKALFSRSPKSRGARPQQPTPASPQPTLAAPQSRQVPRLAAPAPLPGPVKPQLAAPAVPSPTPAAIDQPGPQPPAPQSMIAGPTPAAPQVSTDEKALLPRSKFSRYLNGDNHPDRYGDTGWSKYMPKNRPPAGATAGQQSPPAQSAAAPTPESLPSATLEPVPEVAERPRSKALFSRTPAVVPVPESEPQVAQQPVPPEAAPKVAMPDDPIRSEGRLQPQSARPAVEKLALPSPPVTKPKSSGSVKESPPSPIGHPAVADLRSTTRRTRSTTTAPPVGEKLTVRKAPEKPAAKVVERKPASPKGQWTTPKHLAGKPEQPETADKTNRPASTTITALGADRRNDDEKAAGKSATKRTRDTSRSADPRRPTIVQAEPANQRPAVVSDQAATPRATMVIESVATEAVETSETTGADPRPNPVRLREHRAVTGPVLTSAVSPEGAMSSKRTDTTPSEDAAGGLPNPVRRGRYQARAMGNPLR